ncbi:MAG: EpsG family protein [Psychroserpens sp.]|uniref:EpsG family protein n=1 Tax=Psychroserpens sp. TaxID=2020870 RepID=UPI003C73FF28
MATLFLYLLVMLACMGLVNWSNQNNTKLGIYGAYVILIVVSIIRYDIGNDYSAYMEMIRFLSYKLENNIPLGVDGKEPLITILTYIFRGTAYPFLWVLGAHVIISIGFLYLAFEENDCHIMGIAILFISGLLFINWDQARQGVSISIIIYAIKYIKEKQLLKYVFFVFLAVMAHYSALLLLPFYFIDRIKPQKFLYIGIILVLALSNAATNFFVYLFENVITSVPYWETKETSYSYVQIVSLGYKLRIFFYGLVWSSIIYYLPDKERVLTNFLFIGAVIFIMASGALNIMRISFYMIFTTMISIPIVLKMEKSRIVMLAMVCGLFLFYVRDVITDTGTNGCVPYDTIFSENFPNYSRSRM